MTAEQQADPNKNDRSDSLSESLLRRIQRYEYEGVHLTNKPSGNESDLIFEQIQYSSKFDHYNPRIQILL